MLEEASATKNTRLGAAATEELEVDVAGERYLGVASAAGVGEAADPVAGAADDALS